MNKGLITLTETEFKRHEILKRVIEGVLTSSEAAIALQLSQRQVRRLVKKLRESGPRALAHGNRGRTPAHATPPDIRAKVVELAQGIYRGCNFTFLSELLAEREGIYLSPSTTGRILKAVGIKSPRRHRPPKLHKRRQRKARIGMLVQIDGSDHNWLEDRGPRLVLLIAVDDATGQILAATFRPTEDFEGYRRLFDMLIRAHGLPLVLYSDRHTLFRSPKVNNPEALLAEQLEGTERPMSQIGRMLAELGVGIWHAESPQAKGRVERSFNTLQERLLIHLRLAGARTLEQAERVLTQFIPDYNSRFAKAPADAASAFRPVPAHLRLEHILCWKEKRQLLPGYVVSYNGRQLQPIARNGAPTIPLRATVEIHRLPDDSLTLAYQGHLYDLVPFEKQATVVEMPKQADEEKAGPAPTRPAPGHPWRRPFLPRKQNYTTQTAAPS